jgi:opacity protein-like surface antigen
MKMMIAALACAASAAAAPAGAATSQVSQSEQRAPAAAPAPGAASNLAYFVGQWDISATDPASGTSERFSYEVRPLVGTAWISGRGRSEDMRQESSDVWGLDAASGELMRIVFDGSGTYAIVRSTGWQGPRLVLEGDARSAGGVVRVRETITRLSDDAFTATWEAYRNGAWSVYSVEQVRRREGRG